jgi:hypothetical protein
MTLAAKSGHPFDGAWRHAASLADAEAIEHEYFATCRRECGHERRVPVIERSTESVGGRNESFARAHRPRGDAHAVNDNELRFDFRQGGHIIRPVFV